MLADLWGMVNTLIVPNCNYCNVEVGDGSGDAKGGGVNNNLAVPPPPPPPLVELVVVILFDASFLLPAVATVNCRILPPLGGNTRCI